MPLDPDVEATITPLYEAGALPYQQFPPEHARLGYDAMEHLAEVPAGVSVEETTVPGAGGELAARIYRREDGPASAPGLLYLHGGGCVIGSVRSHHHTAAMLASSSRCTVVSCDYRLAPEHPFPAAVEDAWALTRWFASAADGLGLDPERLAVGGDSAGGMLATVSARRARDANGPELAAQLLIYPVTDWACERPSMEENSTGYVLEQGTMEWFRSCYLPDESQWRDPEASPLYAALDGLPPAVLATCEFDPLRDQGDEYAKRLEEADVAVRHLRYDGLVHTFVQWPNLDACRQATEEIGRELAKLLEG